MDHEELDRIRAAKFVQGKEAGIKIGLERLEAERKRAYQQGMQDAFKFANRAGLTPNPVILNQKRQEEWRKVRLPRWFVSTIALTVVGTKAAELFFNALVP